MSEGHADHKWHAEYLGLLLALLVIFSQGILRITTVPLWGHYDEPTHYEYMRYLVEDRQLPAGQPADYTILERIAATYPEAIIANCYQIDTQGVPCVLIGHQFDQAPGYYLIQAVFQVLFHPARVAGQVRLARIISVLLAVAVGWLGYVTAHTLFPDQPLLAIGTPLLLGLVGGYADLMSALTNDVGAVAAFSLFIYAMTHIIRFGLSPGDGLLLMISLAAAWLAKSSAWIALPLAGIGLLLAYWPALPRWGKVVIGVVMLAGVAGAIQWDPGVGPLLRPAIDRFLPFGGINKRLPFWYDPQHWAYYDQALRWQFVTFWSAFGNGVPGLPRAPLAALLILSGLAATGLVKSWKKSPVNKWQVRGLAFLVLAVLAAFMMSLLRIDNPRPTSYIPTARHFYVAIVPVVLLLLLGWGAWLPAESRKVGLVGMVLGLYALVTWSILNVQIPWFAANWPIPFP